MNPSLLGLDIGSVSISLILLSRNGEILRAEYRFHQGLILDTLIEMLSPLVPGSLAGIACTSSSPPLLAGAREYDWQVCMIEAARHVHGRLGSLLIVGGEKFGLLRFDSEGNFRSLRASTSCAAGTGGFLDQQAGRLGLSGSAEFSELALRNRAVPPKIASRCAVFAKTDLCHAQQAGYSLEEICDGLCLGLARNIADTISTGEAIPQPTVFAGGVSRNRAVAGHLEVLLGCRLEAGPHSHLYGALGAALSLLRDPVEEGIFEFQRAEQLVLRQVAEKSYHYQPLTLKLSDYPEFSTEESRLFEPVVTATGMAVEVDVYAPIERGAQLATILGIDIGSTSTKAVLIDRGKNVLAGFYTRTAGRPLAAVQALLEALDSLLAEKAATAKIEAVGTTGAGRTFIGKVIGADLILNEITAHARAAYELDPEIDTIIEIGGQDSKFTTMRDGLVTFSQMNTVCAAGTGSFIEEQAAKLGVGLSEYSARAEGVRAPLASDRCTVFMERDINHYLNKRYSVEEVLAAALFSVRENYLLKVASEALIGKRICFQGATAKNRSLVAAFEQQLKRPIFVSRYCHLTGALGVALALRENLPERSSFRGLGLYEQQIAVRGETCELCANHCRLRLAEVHGQTVAYGFLCGRDYTDRRFVSRNRSGFDMLREYRRAFDAGPAHGTGAAAGSGPAADRALSVGIPAALHLVEELPLWKRFFQELGIEVRTSEAYREGLKSGKEMSGAEFCAPLLVLHGHARHLAEGCDALFLPVYLDAPVEQRRRGRLRYYCYYTQFSSSVVSLLMENDLNRKCLKPLIDHGDLYSGVSALSFRARRRTKQELLRSLQTVTGFDLTYEEVSRAYDRALDCYRAGRKRLSTIYRDRCPQNGEIAVVLSGRPYQVLSPEMNKGIPEIFASHGIRTFYQDMLPGLEELAGLGRPLVVPGRAAAPCPPDLRAAAVEARRILKEVKPLLDAVHWQFAARILETACTCVAVAGLYPVLITAFKCSPDSFVIEYFKRILDAHSKPYLILQIDEHDSGVGYETRIEAGIHSFRNHAASRRAKEQGAAERAGEQAGLPRPAGSRSLKTFCPQPEHSLDGKTLLFPNWDSLTIPLVVANLRSAGVDARVLEEEEASIREGTRLNTGQCLPVNAIVQSAVDYIGRHGLDPARTLLWMTRAVWSCNITLFPHYMKSLLEAYGGGMEKAGVYVDDLSHSQISPLLGIGAYFAYMFGGLLHRLGCRIRPYELSSGQTDRTVEAARELFVQAFLGERDKEQALKDVIGMFEAIPRSKGRRPKVAIFGDLYVRDNEVMNQDLVRFIEKSGGEVVTISFSEYMLIKGEATFKQLWKDGHLLLLAKFRALLALAQMAERKFFPYYRLYAGPPESYRDPHPEQTLERYNVRLEHTGESFDNLLKISYLMRQHPDLGLFVQTNPAFCCPSLVTEAMARRIEEETGVPVVTVTYDGTGSFKNDRIVPYLAGALHRAPMNSRSRV